MNNELNNELNKELSNELSNVTNGMSYETNNVKSEINYETSNVTKNLSGARFSNGLYDETMEHDACGIGLIASIKGVASHRIVQMGCEILTNLAHRGAEAADGKTSDGAGILTQIPADFFAKHLEFYAPMSQQPWAVGMIFFPWSSHQPIESQAKIQAQQTVFNDLALQLGLKVWGWRLVPVNSKVVANADLHSDVLSSDVISTDTEPKIYQVFLQLQDLKSDEIKLVQLRRMAEKQLREFEGTRHPQTGQVLSQFTVVSLSSSTIVYKGLMLPQLLADYYLDLQDPDFTSAVALVHSRFSTNTLPAWELAHPFRYLCHNGEINTLRGNIHWMKARKLASENLQTNLLPLIREGVSDSSALDQALELLLASGHHLAEAIMMLVPEAWENDSEISTDVKNFYSFYSSRMEPWDGPAALCFTDGKIAGATLDRNGLRPSRYHVMDDDLFVLSSEAGVLNLPSEHVIRRGRLGPGKMILIDMEAGRLIENDEIKQWVSTQHAYGDWYQQEIIDSDLILAKNDVNAAATATSMTTQSINSDRAMLMLTAQGYTEEEVRMVLTPILNDGEEATSSMGSDTPLAILSTQPQLLFKYFRQLFAQVTNPPMDPIRERSVMSLQVILGGKSSPFILPQQQEQEMDRKELHKKIKLKSPILLETQFVAIQKQDVIHCATLDLTFNYHDQNSFIENFQKHLLQLIKQAKDLVSKNHGLLILSDERLMSANQSMNATMFASMNDSMNTQSEDSKSKLSALPVLLVVSAIHQELVRHSLRTQTSIVVDSSEVRDVHQLACCIGFGAEAIYSRAVLQLFAKNEKQKINYQKAMEKGLLKILSKMGIATISSYCGAQIFEALGLSTELVNSYFQGTASRIGGLTLQTLALETYARFEMAQGRSTLPTGGEIHARAQGEMHLWNPHSITRLQKSTQENNYQTYKSFSQEVQRTSLSQLRGLLEFKTSSHGSGSLSSPLSLMDVESAASIVKRFTTGAMSFGALSKEAHETLAIAMNRIGAKSNSGEGGEDSSRFQPEENGDSKNSAIKQVASGRFGVTADYLVHASELQIKMAQGAKPGEGGQLPGYKVDAVIAKMRHSTPGVTLISPPPHHDIYSIEDLAQLIFDLKNINPQARISVKLVSTPGVGTIAAGVAKAHADKILISGDGGGTGASPLSSIKYAGSPWELGLAEAHQTLTMQGLRQKVIIETDGQLRNGWDVAMAAALGAQEFGFSTAPLIVEGCIMMRKCHLNTCPTGVATQDPELRKKFTGTPEAVIRYFFFVAEELREILAMLGLRTVNELIGRVDLLQKISLPKQTPSTIESSVSSLWYEKLKSVDLSKILHINKNLGSNKTVMIKDVLANQLDHQLIAQWQSGALTKKVIPVKNTDRTIGTMLSWAVTKKYGQKGLPQDSILLSLAGTAGQSLGAFLAPGITLQLAGEANDYVGKGLSGGRIIIAPHLKYSSDVIAGNTCLYGATSGELFVAGSVGERFAVRNSGAQAVVEGTGDHACEYMTGGSVIVLGMTGKNFAAGMSGGVAYVLDETSDFHLRCNQLMVEISEVSTDPDFEFLFHQIHRHYLLTGSEKAEKILQSWGHWRGQFKKIISYELLQIQKQQLSTELQLKSQPEVSL